MTAAGDHGARSSGPVASPNGDLWFAFVPVDEHPGDDLVRLEIGEAGGGVTYSSALTWAGWFPVHGCWDDAGRVWVASKDTGISVFMREGRAWRRYAWQDGAAEARRPPMEDVTTGESVAWITAAPPACLRLDGRPDARA